MGALDKWAQAAEELHRVVGEVTLLITEIEDGLDEIILDQLVMAPAHSFFKRRVLGRQLVSAKVDLLIAYASEFATALAAPDKAREHLLEIRDATEQRNRLVHDLHEVDIANGRVSRRRLWEEDGQPIDLQSYRDLAERLTMLSGEGIEGIADGLLVHVPDAGPRDGGPAC